eukprot:TRINITY_DN2056_c0_g1_i5.p1 TRINITY_DN2056_c0_g1~~TRINITY_DN2056_c0_g1_i5.p1  ORF type:complete len:404 (-),score=85.69 TRINITY_DN2056_c0_g1_i5:492-1703(-)
MVNNDESDFAVEVQRMVPGRFENVTPLVEPAEEGCTSTPVLIADDTSDNSKVSLQLFNNSAAHARVRECQQRCCLRANDAPLSPTSGLTSPMSSPQGEPMICDIYELHGSAPDGWLAVMGTLTALEAVLIVLRASEAATDTLTDCDQLLSAQQKRTLFLRVTRAVQTLHSAGLVHNSICMKSVLKCQSGYKLGDYSTLQRHGELANSASTAHPGHLSPEYKRAAEENVTRKCDFATDVWCLGALLSELLLGKLPSQEEMSTVGTFEEVVGEEVAAMLCRMLEPEPRVRPVIDVVLQEAIKCLYLPDDCTAPHELLDFDSPVKDQSMIIRNSTLKHEVSPLRSPKSTIDYCLSPPAHSESYEDPERAAHHHDKVKRESDKTKGHERKETEDTSSSNCECKCVIQ